MNKSFVKQDIVINADTSKVWDVLVDPQLSKRWADAFSEGAYVETNWKNGSEVLWKDKEGNIGAKGIVKTSQTGSLLEVGFYDDINMAPPAPTGEYVERYALSEQDGKTLLRIEAGPLPEKDIEAHAPLWNKAMAKMKELAEE